MRKRILLILLSIITVTGCGKKEETPATPVSTVDISVEEEDVKPTEESVEEIIEDEAGNTTEEQVVEETESKENKDEETKEPAKVEENVKEESEVSEAPAVKESGTPVANHGELSVKGTQLVDKNGNPYQIKGVSTHGLGWFPEYVNKDCFKTIRDEWGANCIRLAMYTAEYNGYCSGGSKDNLKQIVNNGVSYATDLGMYVIIDWHILQDNDPNTNKSEAIKFFDEMSKKYADYDNVIYEICNEPNSGTSWSQVKSYAEEVIPVIKANNKDAIIIVGTPTWSQDVDQAASNPIKGYTNIMYTIHFYAETHRDSLRQKMTNAINAGIPIFCTEFGICDASGNGTINIDEANKWISEMNANGVSYCIWNLSNKAESSSLIASGCSKTSGWTESDLSEEGKWYVGVLKGKATGKTAPSTNNSDNNQSNNNNNNNNSNNTQSAAATASSSNTAVTLTMANSWDEGGSKCYQYTVNVKNTSSSAIRNWKVTVDFGTSVSINNSWNGVFTVNGNKVVITPADYTNEISAGASQEVGLIIKASGSVNSSSVSIN